jgi:hypothetical protein
MYYMYYMYYMYCATAKLLYALPYYHHTNANPRNTSITPTKGMCQRYGDKYYLPVPLHLIK